MSGVSISQYRASVGHYYGNALRVSNPYMCFLNYKNIYPFLFLIFYGRYGVPLALLSFLYLSSMQVESMLARAYYDYRNSCKCNVKEDVNGSAELTLTTILLFTFLLLLCGDIHPNPGPPHPYLHNKLKIVHSNVCSLQNKALRLEAELNSFDIITVSETWLYKDFPTDRVRIDGYYAPIRKDREDGTAYGGVAIYVKNNLICKPRPDLDVPQLEAVWVETRLNQETLLVGSFYRAPDARVSYWDLIDESINLAINTSQKFVILGLCQC